MAAKVSLSSIVINHDSREIGHAATTNRAIVVAGHSLLVYDYFITLDDEVGIHK